ncbi:hypothetical protein JCM10914A_08500 [Paenibacillus sp. JCM 10914]|uniref:hypothetical protein n=1 Tax=Paenibacillus sp. JCM 10914 TaxID=1236974 RepID=UPI0003CCA7CF|nr:hypothetical protein [Paenibacillus sp. JCM 10914]GAE05633.1 hypothetical protein JCM10914_1743 [Paenibacillus sp. JCM 10914]
MILKDLITVGDLPFYSVITIAIVLAILMVFGHKDAHQVKLTTKVQCAIYGVSVILATVCLINAAAILIQNIR